MVRGPRRTTKLLRVREATSFNQTPSSGGLSSVVDTKGNTVNYGWDLPG